MYATSGRVITSTSQILDGTVQGADIANDTILDANIGAHTSTKITARNIEHGLAASRPASPAVGDCYISTDTKVVNMCVSAGAWQVFPAAILDGSGTQGDVLYFNGTHWVVLGAGTSGYFLKTQGAGANPIWDVAGVAIGTAIAGPSYNTPVQAATAGFFMWSTTSASGVTTLDAKTDSASTPTTIVASTSIASGATGWVMAPVKKNDYYMVSVGGNPSNTKTYFIPLGS